MKAGLAPNSISSDACMGRKGQANSAFIGRCSQPVPTRFTVFFHNSGNAVWNFHFITMGTQAASLAVSLLVKRTKFTMCKQVCLFNENRSSICRWHCATAGREHPQNGTVPHQGKSDIPQILFINVARRHAWLRYLLAQVGSRGHQTVVAIARFLLKRRLHGDINLRASCSDNLQKMAHYPRVARAHRPLDRGKPTPCRDS